MNSEVGSRTTTKQSLMKVVDHHIVQLIWVVEDREIERN